MIRFVGDISTMDANVLATHVRTANNILEFGLGGSTQVICQNKSPSAEFVSVETQQKWIDITSNNLKLLGLGDQVTLLNYALLFTENKLTDEAFKQKRFDVIFVDGQPELREAFFNETFDLLRVGGVMIVHDTKRKGDLRWFFRSCLEVWSQISRIDLNIDHSCTSVVHKKIHDKNVNWNISEEREKWESGYEPPPDNWMSLVKEKYERQMVKEDWK